MEPIEVGYQVFTSDGGEEVGAVREVTDDTLVVYVENGGEFVVPMSAVASVHSQKVILRLAELDPSMREALMHAHDAEEPGL
jgi:hypothetical protein